MPVALMYPSLDRLCDRISTLYFQFFSRLSSYHQKVCLGVFPVRSLNEDTARAQVAWERHAQVRIIEDTKVLRLRRVRCANLARVHFQFGLAKAATLDKDLICDARVVSEGSGGGGRIEGLDVRLGARSSASIGFLSSGSTRSAAIVVDVGRDSDYMGCAYGVVVFCDRSRATRRVCMFRSCLCFVQGSQAQAQVSV
jgi:hypothetical protein